MSKSQFHLEPDQASDLLAEVRSHCQPGESLGQLMQRQPGIVSSGALDRENRSLSNKLRWALQQARQNRVRADAIQAELADIALIRNSLVKRRPGH